MGYKYIILIVYFAYLVLMSLATFFIFGKDKKMAVKGGGPVRIKEKTLLGLCVFGGACGGFLGRLFFHHKTDKSYFSFTIYVGILMQAAVAALLVAMLFM